MFNNWFCQFESNNTVIMRYETCKRLNDIIDNTFLQFKIDTAGVEFRILMIITNIGSIKYVWASVIYFNQAGLRYTIFEEAEIRQM